MQKRRPILSALFALVLSAIVLALTPLNARAADVIASGTWGTCPWEITDDGVLTVHPGVGESQSGKEFSPWSDYSGSITAVVFANENGRMAVAPENSAHLFHGLRKIVSIDLSGLDITGVSSMRTMFSGCSSLSSLDVSGWDTSSVTDMQYMFNGCSSLAHLDVSSWDTSSVRGTGSMFCGCSSLVALDVFGWDVSNVGVWGMQKMFDGCSALAYLNVSGWNTSHVSDMGRMFAECSSLASLDVSNWDTSSVTDMSSMFSGCTSLTDLDVSDFETMYVHDMSGMFRDCSSLTFLDVSNWQTLGSSYAGPYLVMSDMFNGCSSLASLDVSNWDTSSVTDMSGMFGGCSSLASLDVSNWDTSSVTDMSSMFLWCSSLASLDVSLWDTSCVTDMSSLFFGCPSLTSLDVSGWDTSGVTDMSRLFSGCTSLTNLDVSGWTTPLVTNLKYMFSSCESLSFLNLAGWDTSNVENMSDMFYSCSSLIVLNLVGWDTSSVERMSEMFAHCPALTTIYAGDGWTTARATTPKMFEEDVSLVGGNGTEYDSSHTDGDYARIDGPDTPGYFTFSNDPGEDGQIKLGSAIMTLNGLNYDLLTTERTIDVVAKDTKFTLTVKLKDNSQRALVFILYQVDIDGNAFPIARAGSDGSFGTLTYSQFKVDQQVYVNVFDGDGHLVLTKQLLLTVKDSRMDDIPSSFQIGDGVELTFSGWPLEDLKVSFPLTEFPITCMITDDGTVQLGVNFDVKDAFSNDPTFWQTMHDNGFWRDAFRKAEYNNFLLQSGYKNWIGKPKWGFNVIGYLEGDLATKVFKGHLAFEITFGGSWEHQSFVLAIPVVYEVSAKVGGSASTDAVFHVEGKKLVLDDATLDIGLKGTFGAYGGVGLACMASGGVWGSVTVGGTYAVYPEAVRGLKDIYGSGEMGLKVLVLSYPVKVTLFSSSKHYYYRRDTSTRQSESMTAQPESIPQLLAGVDPSVSYEQLDRSYLSEMTGWNGVSEDGGPMLLQAGGYPYAEVMMTDVEGGQLLVFLTDDASRGSANRTQLVWSRYDASSGLWSDPSPVWDDGTADFYPSICSDGLGGAWVSWSNARIEVADGLSLEDEAALYDISVAHFSADSGSFEAQAFVTDDSARFEVSPSVGAAGGNPVVAWVSNPSDDIFGLNGAQMIASATLEGDSWHSNDVATSSAYIISAKVGWLGTPAVAWSTDDDGSMETIEDSRTYVWTEESGVSVIGDSNSWNPVFAVRGGEPVLAWCQDGVLMTTADGVSSSSTGLEYVPKTAFHLLGDIENDALISFTRYQDSSGDVFGRRVSSGEWGDEFALTSQGQSVTSWAIAGSSAEPTIVYAASTETESTSTDSGIWVNVGTGIELVSADGAWYEDDEGSIVVAVTNGGSTSLDSVTVTVTENGETITASDASVSLAPGESGFASISFDKPSDGSIHTYEVSISCSSDVFQLVMGNPVLIAKPVHGLSDEGETAGVMVTNAGGSATQEGTVVWRDLATGEVLGETILPVLAPGESTEITFSADGMLFENGIMSTEIVLSAANQDGEMISAVGFVESFGEAIDDELDENETGGGPWDIAEAEITEIKPQEFTGSSVEPKPIVRWMGKRLRLGRDYTVSYEDNTNVGTATAVITGAGAFEGSVTITFEIAGSSSESYDISDAMIFYIPDQVYTGYEIEPELTILFNETELVQGVDYIATYSNNIEVGMAWVTVEGIGNYKGTVESYFWIVGDEPYEEAFFLDADPYDDANHGAEVDWMGTSGISVGWEVVGGRVYRGLWTVKRCDFAAFLYRMADLSDDGDRNDSIALTDEEVAEVLSNVKDCTPSTDHAAEIAWLISTGISRGWANSDGAVSFRPYAEVARQDMAAFLYRYADLQDDGQQNQSPIMGDQQVTFSDVRHGDDANHAAEVEWLASVGVTRGWDMGNGTYQFRGTNIVARQDMAAFMYRLYTYLLW
ncbi:MAG: BspA family leucine-rich repeat surface protein [Atopobiaceae bacterium]|nr:BspA family leucine-rich repeat surface protein [Atopobiaceae bacterium]